MLYRKIITVFSQIQTKHISTVCEQNVELLKVKPGGTYSNHNLLKFSFRSYVLRYCRFSQNSGKSLARNRAINT